MRPAPVLLRLRRNPVSADEELLVCIWETRSETCTLAWISVDNTGNDDINMVAVLSAPGFEEFMREASAPEGQKNAPLTQAENDQIEKTHAHDVVYKEL